MGVIARRLQDTDEDWRHVYKSLLLLEFMSKHGPQKVRNVECLVSLAQQPSCEGGIKGIIQHLTFSVEVLSLGLLQDKKHNSAVETIFFASARSLRSL